MEQEPDFVTRWLVTYGAHLPNHPGKWWVHARLRTHLRVRPTGDRLVERAGLRWLLDPADYVQADVFWFGTKDPWELWHLSQHLPVGGVFLDVGSNFGFYSIALASKLGGRCGVFAFEPNPPTFNRLCRNVELNGLQSVVQARCVAMSDRDGSAVLFQVPHNSGASRVDDSGVGIATQMQTLDQFCRAEELDRVDAVKIDVEGFEARVLKGATEMLKQFRPVVAVELNPPALQQQGVCPATVVDLLGSVGYEIFEVRRRQLVPLVHLPAGEDYVNVICIPAK